MQNLMELQKNEPQVRGAAAAGRQGFVRRRGSLQQGRALETLGHAVEYLVDCRMFETRDEQNDQEAIQMLMRASRAVFVECPEVISVRTRLRQWIRRRPAGN